MPGPSDSPQPLAVASADPFYASLVSPLAPPPGHAPMGWGMIVGPSVRPDLRGDQLLSDIWPQPYRGPLDLDNFGRETPEMRRAFRELYAKEPAVRAAIDGSVAAVAALDVTVLPDDGDSDADKRAAEFVDWCVERTPRGWDGLITDVLKPARIDGFAVLEITLEEVESRKWGRKWGLKHVRSIDTAHVRLQLDQYRNVVSVVNTVRGLEYHGPRKEIIFTDGGLFHNPFGTSTLRTAYRNAYLISVAYEIWSRAITVFGAPVVTGKYKQAETRGILEKALQALRAGGYMAVPDGCEVQVLNFASATGFDAFEAHVAKCREEIYLAVRGAYLPFTQGSGGADQRGDTATHKVGSDTSEYLLAKAVQRCLTRQLVPHLVRPNFGDEVGLPKVVLGGTNWGETKQQLEVAAQLQQMGLPLSKKQLYETGQHSPPADDGDALNPPSAGPGPGGPPGGPGGGLGEPPTLFADKAGQDAALAPVGAAVLEALGIPQQFDGFDPALHPRDHGKFAPKGSGSGGDSTLPESAAKHPKVVEAGKRLAAGAAGLAAKVHAAAVSAGVTPESLLGSPEDWLRIWSTHHADAVAHHLGVDAMTAAQVLTHLASHAIARVKPLVTKGVGFAEWDEDKHPRDGGKFAPKGGGESAPTSPPPVTAAPKPEFHHQHTAALVQQRAKKLRGVVAALGRGDIGDDEFRDAVSAWEAKTRHQIGQRYRDAHQAAADKFRADFGPDALAGPDGVRLKEAFLTAAAHAKDLASGIASAAGEHAGEDDFGSPKVRAARQEFEDRVYGAGAKLNKLHDPVYERLKAIRDRLAGDRKGEFKLGRYFYSDYAEPARTFAEVFAGGPDAEGHYPGNLHELAGMGERDFADRSHLVRKQIARADGVKTWVWVNPDKGKHAGREGTPRRGPDYHPTRDAETAVAAAVNDPARVSPGHLDELSKHLDTLPRDRLRDLARQVGEKLGGRKAELADRLLAHVRGQREGRQTPGSALERTTEPELQRTPAKNPPENPTTPVDKTTGVVNTTGVGPQPATPKPEGGAMETTTRRDSATEYQEAQARADKIKHDVTRAASGRRSVADDQVPGATPAQVEYYNNLVGRTARPPQVFGPMAGSPETRGKAIRDHWLADNLPVPTTRQELSEMIDVMKSPAGVTDYARRHPEWSGPLMKRLAEVVGPKGERVAELTGDAPVNALPPDEKRAAYNSPDARYHLTIGRLLRGEGN